MATTYTSRAKLGMPATSDRNWDVPVNANTASLDTYNAIGALCVTTVEIPSASLNVAVAAGTFAAPGGVIVSYAGTASQALTPSATNYLYLNTAGTLVVNTTGFPASTSIVRLASVAVGSGTVGTITDARMPYRTAGALESLPLAASDASGVLTVHTGSTNGVDIGGATTDKLGLWGVTPVPQPTSGSQAAMGALTTSVLTVSTGGVNSVTLAAATNVATLTDSSGGTSGGTLAAITAGASYAQADLVALQNAVATFAAQWALQKSLNTVLINAITSIGNQLNAARVDVGAAQTLVNALRSAGVSLGAWKGS